MVRKIELHLDALAVIGLVFVASFGFNLYQRSQYASLLKEHTALQWKSQDTDINLLMARANLQKCTAAAHGSASAPGAGK